MNFNNFTIIVHGVSSHGSTPQHGRDAIVAASAILLNLQTLVSRINDPLNPLVLTVEAVTAGTQFNIITDKAVLDGTVCTCSDEMRKMAEENILRMTESTAAANGCAAELIWHAQENDAGGEQ